MTSGSRCDVIIVGGGPAGSATAAAVAERGLATMVVEPAVRMSDRIGETVPAEIEPLLARLTVRDEFLHDDHLPAAATASSWGSSELAWRDGMTSALGAGWHLSRGKFDETIMRAAARRGATLLRGWRVVGARPLEDQGWLVKVRARDGALGELQASFLVDATGRGAVVARRLGAVRMVDDDLVGIFSPLDSRGADSYPDTVIESVEDGWWYAGRLPDGRWMTAFFTDGAQLRRRRLLQPLCWHRHLEATAHLFSLLGRPTAPGSVRVASARSQRLDHPAGPRWLAVGDAAMAWDPLTSAGIVLALRFGLTAGETVDRLLSGDDDTAKRYEAEYLALHSRYLAQRRAFYSLETRWPESPFWQRRAGAGSPRWAPTAYLHHA